MNNNNNNNLMMKKKKRITVLASRIILNSMIMISIVCKKECIITKNMLRFYCVALATTSY